MSTITTPEQAARRMRSIGEEIELLDIAIREIDLQRTRLTMRYDELRLEEIRIKIHQRVSCGDS